MTLTKNKMTTLEQQARAYAEERLKGSPQIWKEAMRRLIAEAYEQGWVDRGWNDLNKECEKRVPPSELKNRI